VQVSVRPHFSLAGATRSAIVPGDAGKGKASVPIDSEFLPEIPVYLELHHPTIHAHGMT
jgi:hypothetical protein